MSFQSGCDTPHFLQSVFCCWTFSKKSSFAAQDRAEACLTPKRASPFDKTAAVRRKSQSPRQRWDWDAVGNRCCENVEFMSKNSLKCPARLTGTHSSSRIRVALTLTAFSSFSPFSPPWSGRCWHSSPLGCSCAGEPGTLHSAYSCAASPCPYSLSRRETIQPFCGSACRFMEAGRRRGAGRGPALAHALSARWFAKQSDHDRTPSKQGAGKPAGPSPEYCSDAGSLFLSYSKACRAVASSDGALFCFLLQFLARIFFLTLGVCFFNSLAFWAQEYKHHELPAPRGARLQTMRCVCLFWVAFFSFPWQRG